ncbi:GNAT family N-acetyltransferase [Niveibacterium terrae]|uniref:GNAT family N-acetyltransferase n=1 Tax=Niveibacterium terrae TaxID=3373598 RepID=UPI003A951DE2
MHEIPPEGFAEFLPWLSDLPINELFARSVLRGRVRGQAWVDRRDDPRLLHILHPYGMSLLVGQVSPQTLPALVEHLLGREQWLQLWPATGAEPLIEALVTASAGKVQRFVRSNFRFDAKAHRARRLELEAPSGVGLVRMDGGHFAELELSVSPRAFWRDAAHFEHEGLGFCATENGEPSAAAFSAFLIDAQLEIGIETRPARRGRGHALWAACALIEECERRNLLPVWSCRRENTASWKLAQKLGFVPTLELPYLRVSA